MPYILVNIALDVFSLVLFCTTSVALLLRSRFASRWLPPQLRERKTLTLIVTQGLVLAVLSIVAMGVVSRLRHVDLFSLTLFDVFFFIGLLNSMVLAYQLLDARCFPSMPKLRRRVLIAVCSAVITCVPVFVAVTTIVRLLVIK